MGIITNPGEFLIRVIVNIWFFWKLSMLKVNCFVDNVKQWIHWVVFHWTRTVPFPTIRSGGVEREIWNCSLLFNLIVVDCG